MEKYFEKNLKFLRKEKNISQQELANRIKKINRSTISRYESGEIDPTIGNVLLIANYFNVSISDLLFEDLQSMNKDEFNKYLDANKHLLTEEDKDMIKYIIEKRVKK